MANNVGLRDAEHMFVVSKVVFVNHVCTAAVFSTVWYTYECVATFESHLGENLVRGDQLQQAPSAKMVQGTVIEGDSYLREKSFILSYT